MTPSDFEVLLETVENDEGFKQIPYVDTAGVLTIGFGTDLSEGITRGEATYLCSNRLQAAFAALTQAHPVVLTLSPIRQIVLGNMAYNLGVPKLNGFAKMWAAIERGEFDTASVEMLDSTWAHQVGARATRLASEMRSGVSL